MQTILLLVSGLVLFLYALNTLSDSLRQIGGEKLKAFLDRFTSNLVKGILSGIIVTILLGLMLLPQFTQLVLFISQGSSIQQIIANAHMLFNVLGVLSMIPFVPLFERFLEKLVQGGSGRVTTTA